MAIDGLPGPQIFRQRDVRRNATASVTVAQQLSPIGSIVAWAKSLTGVPVLPAGWVECDGAVLSDADSLLDGQTIPDLNGDNRFLRGAATSGGTGGSETMAHTHDLTSTWGSFNPDGTGGHSTFDLTDVPNPLSAGASNSENKPPYYEVVWIMRIK